MPWETAHGLNPEAGGQQHDVAASGYTHLEDYLNWLAAPRDVTTKGETGQPIAPAASPGK